MKNSMMRWRKFKKEVNTNFYYESFEKVRNATVDLTSTEFYVSGISPRAAELTSTEGRSVIATAGMPFAMKLALSE